MARDHAENSGTAAWLDRIVERTIRSGATDLHLEPDGAGWWFRIREAAGWSTERLPPEIAGDEAVARIKALAGLDPNERRVPLDGRLAWRGGSVAGDFRVATLPSLHGEVIALRSLQRCGALPELGGLGLGEIQEARVRSWLERRRGLVVVAGPTGAGKTTTAYAALGCLDSRQLKIVTVEDPVEFLAEGFVQVAVDSSQALTFAAALRALLRQDPDVLFVGEVRDAETAAIAVQAALTGHGVVVTLHAASIDGAVARLVDLGVEPFLVAEALTGVVVQRLVPRLCVACRQGVPWPCAEGEAADRNGEEAVAPRALAAVRGSGCPVCEGKGVVGRLGFFEAVAIDAPLRDVIAREGASGNLRAAVARQGAIGLRAQVVSAARRGAIAVTEMQRWID